MSAYDFKAIEKKWAPKFEELQAYKGIDFENDKEKFYMLTEFPYPSGSGLHVGHAFSMTGADVYARFQRMNGYNVMFPMGWDAFGLPTENFAIKTGRKPQEITKEVTDNFRKQMKKLGLSFDWEREVNTTLPGYYKWTQWIFTKLFEKGLARKEEMPINWCPKDKIGLANEEVIDGKCERCGTEVEKRTLSQWVVKITDYADRLINGLYDTEFIEKVKAAQVNWIGKKEGAKIRFEVKNHPEKLEVFTTRPDTIAGATFLVIAPEHPLVKEIGSAEVKKYTHEVKNKSEIERTDIAKEKTGVFSGLMAVNPITQKEIPVWIADYVTMSFGTGAIMAVPAHDNRDFAFAKKFGLGIVPVVIPRRHYVDENAKGYYERRQKKNKEVIELLNKTAKENGKSLLISGGWAALIQVGTEYRECEDIDVAFLKSEKEWWNEQLKGLGFEIGPLFGQDNPEEYYQAVRKPANELDTHIDIDIVENKDSFDQKEFESERYWVLKKEILIEEKIAGISEGKERRWKEDADFVMLGYKPYEGYGISVNSDRWNGLESEETATKVVEFLRKSGLGEEATTYHLRDWIFSRQHYWGEPIPMIYCEKDGWVSVPLADLPVVLPEVEKYLPTDTGESPLANIKEWVETTCPKCGEQAKRETDTMPNWAGSDWYFLRYCDPNNEDELAEMKKMEYWMPVDVYVGGDEHNTLHLLYSRFIYQFLWDIGAVPKGIPEPYKKRLSHGVVLGPDGNRMSKSKGNVIVPDEVMEKYGADVLRTYMMFMGPFDATMAWNERSLVGVKRFIEKLFVLILDKIGTDAESDKDCLRSVHRLVKDAKEDLMVFKFNTVIARLMATVNELSEPGRKIAKRELVMLTKVLAPFAPFAAEEIWSILGEEFSVHAEMFPEFNEKYLNGDKETISVQINGKHRGVVTVSPDAEEATVRAEAEKQENINKYMKLGEIKKVVYIKGKAINFVVV